MGCEATTDEGCGFLFASLIPPLFGLERFSFFFFLLPFQSVIFIKTMHDIPVKFAVLVWFLYIQIWAGGEYCEYC